VVLGDGMAAEVPTILATSGGIVPGTRTRWRPGPLTHFALDLAGVDGRAPRVCFLGTAYGDDSGLIRTFHEIAHLEGWQGSHLALFPMPNLEDVDAHLREQDLIWVWGGSVAGLLAMWRLHGVDQALRAAWQAGVVLTGVSAGSLCWHAGGTTDSFGPDLQPVDGLGFLPWSNGVHYDSEPQRRPVFHELVRTGRLPDGYATDDGAGLLYRGSEMVEALSEVADAGAYKVERVDGEIVETSLPVRELG
jgi:peptidase E